MEKQVIICVDDEAIVLDALNEQLQNEFGEEILIEAAESGEEALEIFEEYSAEGYQVPVVVADFIMPNMKGDELLAKIHSRNVQTKKIMLTGQASIEGVSNAVNSANLYRYIAKPWDKSDLLLTIKEAIKSFNQAKIIVQQNDELKKLNSELEERIAIRTRELEETNKTKDKFFSIIAHDLKNPFNSLIGFSELLLQNYSSFEADQVKQYISIIFETAESSYVLLENLLEWSRSQTGKLVVDLTLLDIYSLAEENVKFLETAALKKNIDLLNNIDSEVKAIGDKNTINTVIRNLLSNAIKFTPRSGSVTIDARKEEENLVVSVADTGIGMDQETINKLFRIDVNLSTSGTENETGTGLGLILCKEFISKNNGTIWVESEPEKGSTFYFSIPLEK